MRILVTRPEPGAQRTAARLRELGHDPVLLPLSRIVAVTPNPVPATLGFLGTVITSANAIAHMPVSLHRRLSELPCHVVGNHTARLAENAGFDVRTVAADTGELGVRLREIYSSGDKLAYPCGRVRLMALKAELNTAGIELFEIEVYDTIQFSHAPDFILKAISGQPIDGILAYSVVAARQIRGLLDSHNVKNFFNNSIIYCLSPRIAAEFSGFAGQKVITSSEPNEEALLRLMNG